LKLRLLLDRPRPLKYVGVRRVKQIKIVESIAGFENLA
jgi:hypothetical protein